jgi:hypothetical protein
MTQRSIAWLAMLTITMFLVLVICVVVLPRLLYPPLSPAELQNVPSAKERIELQLARGALENNARTPLLQGLGGILVAAGLFATWQQIKISRDRQITDRFAHAIDQLGDDKPEVRVGGIRALERIASNSKEDRTTIAYVIGAFVRVRVPLDAASPDRLPQTIHKDFDEEVSWLQHHAPDVQTAMWVLGSRKPAKEPVQLYLSRVNLRGAHLAEANLSGTQLRHTDLAHAWMPRTNLNHSDLESADLRQANLQDAQLRETMLQGANLHGARLEGADLTGARSNAQTIWPDGFDVDRLRNAGVLVVEEPQAEQTTPDHSNR